MKINVINALELLKLHHDAFYAAKPFADETQHPNPSDTRGWSQILVSLLYEKKGIARKKGADLEDGSDVKAASTWDAIDTPRFNGVIKAGTKSEASGTMDSLDIMPKLFFVLWDKEPHQNSERCRVWVVRPQHDIAFRDICNKWYTLKNEGKITSNNFQLHPPRNRNNDVLRNTCGNLKYPLYFCAVWVGTKYDLVYFDEKTIDYGVCSFIMS